MPTKSQRVRDPVHDMIKFDDEEFEESLWQIVQTYPFQRLRRIRQLGFSELVFPGATHTRFSHSIGVFHTARQLMAVIRRHIDERTDIRWRSSKANVAIAAALVHDVGHGMFSHAFEDVAKKLDLGMASHEDVSERLIRDSEITEPLNINGGGFADDVATLIGRKGPGTLYDAVVSSQFDADRLDYIRRDPLMAGVQSGGIDFPWLIDNLEVGELPAGVDDAETGSIETFVLGPKSVMAAEAYVLALFQVYPTIYWHKTTRAAEKVFSALMTRLITLIRDGHREKTGIPEFHPLEKFANSPDSLESILALDDALFWGSLGMMVDATDPGISGLAGQMRDRRLPKCIDIRPKIEAAFPISSDADEDARRDRAKSVDRLIVNIENRLTEWDTTTAGPLPRLYVDRAKRDPYTRGNAKGPAKSNSYQGPQRQHCRYR